MNIYLIRHGQTDWNGGGRLQGNIDTNLNEIGVNQARLAGKRLANQEIGLIYCSNLARAIQTAQLMNDFLQAPLTIVPELREISYGQWEGRLWEEIRRENPDFVQRWLLDRTNLPVPGGESFQDVKNRLQSVIALLQNHASPSVAVVTHEGIIKTLICMFLAIDLEKQARFLFHNGSISTITYDSIQGYRIINLNDTAHQETD
jgi:broad specificity phosphatase PhoE